KLKSYKYLNCVLFTSAFLYYTTLEKINVERLLILKNTELNMNNNLVTNFDSLDIDNNFGNNDNKLFNKDFNDNSCDANLVNNNSCE
ncbi:9167_t:CDS:1, partial [Dentiscutata heterogama]